MKYVTGTDAIRYGFGMISYILLIFVIGAIPAFFGFNLSMTGITEPGGDPGALLIGLAIWFGGALVFVAGFLGALWMVIVDGVATAIEKQS